MTAFDWLKQHSPALPDLKKAEREAITDFCVFWSIFELRLLGGHAGSDSIDSLCREWSKSGKVASDTFEPALTYFKQRYIRDGSPSYHFEHLHLTAKDAPRVLAVLKEQTADMVEISFATLMVIYRFRNNLFHGTKWTYWLQDQLENFQHANSILTRGLALLGPLD